MHVKHLDPSTFFQAYGVDLQMLYPWEGVVKPPFGAAWAVLAPGTSTKQHQHQEGETFFVVRGQGTITVDGEVSEVEQGSVMFHDPFHEHTLTNTSQTEDLLFLTVWWEDRALWARPEGDADTDTEATTEAAEEGPRRVMVTAAPPTPNGDLHLGHLAGPYLGADFYARYLRLRGREGHYACGTDDNCMYVEQMGISIDMTGEQAAEYFSKAIVETLDMAGADMTVFMRAWQSPHFEPLVLAFFDRLQAAGKLEARESDAPFCEPCDRYLFEALVAGDCPHCGNGVTGNTCEDCGRINDCVDLVDAHCTTCKTPATKRPVKRLIFPLSRYGDALRRYHRTTTMNAHLRSFCERAVEDGLPDVAVSHVSDWGIRVPGQGLDLGDQTLYVWFEMAARYFAYAEHINDHTGVAGGDYGRFWRDDEAEIVQFFGFDNSFYYAIMLPALYMAFDDELRLPSAFVTNEFYRLDGEKFSTSRGHSILGRTLLGVAPRDAVRYYLAYSGPEREGTNFTVEAFESTVERELTNGWQPWLHGLAAKVREEFEGTVPATGDWTSEQLHFFRRMEQMIDELAESYEPATFSPQRATRILNELVRTARRFGAAEDHWRDVADRSQERRTGVALELVAAKVLAVSAYPLMPDFATRLWRDLGFEGPIGQGTWERSPSWVPDGQRIGDLDARYFPSVRGCLERTPEEAGA